MAQRLGVAPLADLDPAATQLVEPRGAAHEDVPLVRGELVVAEEVALEFRRAAQLLGAPLATFAERACPSTFQRPLDGLLRCRTTETRILGSTPKPVQGPFRRAAPLLAADIKDGPTWDSKF